jgi:hypothetical protein
MVIEKLSRQQRQTAYLIFLLSAVVVADGIISQFLISNGLGYEGNPFLADLVGTNDFLVIKVAGAFLAALILWKVNTIKPGMTHWLSVVLLILYTTILVWNILVFIVSQL